MSRSPQPGDRFTTVSGLHGEITEWLGEGAQGAVFAAAIAGGQVALKWYHPAAATPQQQQRLQQIVAAGSPCAAFLWPQDLVRIEENDGFGYLMPLRPASFVSLNALMTRAVDAPFSVMATAAREMAHALLLLHARGFCYRDISFGNVFLDPHSGKILITDNDNVVVDGTGADGILGTPRFMAPEIVRGEAQPGIAGDLYSLAVVLFYLLMLHHPLEGRREAAIHSLDLPAMQQLYGRAPLFIFDPADDSNAPVPGLHDNALTFWPMYPQFVRDLFVRSFTEGLHAPQRRVRETEWRAAMTELIGLTFTCEPCGAELVHPEPFTPEPVHCWQCRQSVPRPLGLRYGSRIVLLQAGRKMEAAQAEVVRHPQHPGRLGLKNHSPQPWRCRMPGQAADLVVPPGQSVALLPGARFFWEVAAEVCMV